MKGRLANPRALAALAATTLLLAACGDDGSDDESRDTTGSVEIVRAQFPEFQRLAEQSTFEIAVRNTGSEPIADLAVTLRGLTERAADNPGRGLWVIDAPPRGAVTATTDTWSAGRVDAGATATLRWLVTAIEPGHRTLTYSVAGKRGSVRVRVTDKAPKARVDPRTGEVIRDKSRSGG